MPENKLQSAPDSVFADADTNPGTAYELGRKDERERCARIALSHRPFNDEIGRPSAADVAAFITCEKIATAIRRGE